MDSSFHDLTCKLWAWSCHKSFEEEFEDTKGVIRILKSKKDR